MAEQKIASLVKVIIDEQTAVIQLSNIQLETRLVAEINELREQVTNLCTLIADKKKDVKSPGKKEAADATKEKAEVTAKVSPDQPKAAPLNMRSRFVATYKENVEFRTKFTKPELTAYIESDAAYKSKPAGTPARLHAEAGAVWKYLSTNDKEAIAALKVQFETVSEVDDVTPLTIEPIN